MACQHWFILGLALEHKFVKITLKIQGVLGASLAASFSDDTPILGVLGNDVTYLP